MDTKDRLYEAHAEMCKALSHPKRLEILDILRNGEYSVEAIAQRTGMQKSNLSQHLSVLRKARLVTTRRQGLNIFYGLADPAVLEACDILKKVLLDSWAESGSIASSVRE